MTFKATADFIDKDPTTISKKVKLYAKTHSNSYVTLSETYSKLLKVPYVCNGCKQKSSVTIKAFSLYYEVLFVNVQF